MRSEDGPGRHHASPAITIVVVPRERFEFTCRSLENLYENTEEPFTLIYIDAGSPAEIHRRLLQLAKERNFTLVRCEKYLAPNQARNLGLRFVTSEYVVFVDNDVVFAPGWLTSLRRCAEETGAAIVTPLVCFGWPAHTIIHNAGGPAEFVEEGGRRVFKQSPRDLVGRPVSEVRTELKREKTGQCEFHAVLVRTEVFSKYGKLDENNMSTFDHTDLSLVVRANGGHVVFEPESVVTYVAETPRLRELPFFMLRWSDEWTVHSHRTFLDKWKAEEGKPHYTMVDFVKECRAYGMPSLRKRLVHWCGWRLGSRVIALIESGLIMLGRLKFAGLAASPLYRVAYAGGVSKNEPMGSGSH